MPFSDNYALVIIQILDFGCERGNVMTLGIQVVGIMWEEWMNREEEENGKGGREQNRETTLHTALHGLGIENITCNCM